MSFVHCLWLMMCSYLFVTSLVMLFPIVADVFRDPKLVGLPKALWRR
ncbi:MAG TPA: hypothetical protein VNT27_03615 [Propionibacteriaceae bacterium]|nr:hypothetical protein [Propionibacteriaceae bacterium]